MSENVDEISFKSEELKENNIDIIDIVNKNINNMIYFKRTNTFNIISPKSINKIFSLILNKDQECLSDIYIDHITINILSSNNQFENNNLNENIIFDDNNNSELDNKYINILNNTTTFYINFNFNNNIEIKKKSLLKIFNHLNKSIISNSDYINLVILYLKNENKNDLVKLTIEKKILKKYKGENKIQKFNGIKQFNSSLKIPPKNKIHNIYEIDNFFNKILDHIDNYDNESSFSDKINNNDLAVPRKTIDEDLIKVVNVSFMEEGILTEGDNNENVNKNDTKIKHGRQSSNISVNNGDICSKRICNGICYII